MFDHEFLIPDQPTLFQRFKSKSIGLSWKVWLVSEQSKDFRLFRGLEIGLNPLGYLSKVRLKGTTADTLLTLDQAIQHVRGTEATQNKPGNIALLGMGKYVLMERDDISLTAELERLFSLTPSWATNRGWTCIVREPFHSDLAEKIQPFFDTFRVGISYCLAPWSLTCPWNNSDHLNVHRCGIVCKCSVVDREGNHYYRKQKEPICSCNGTLNSHHCNEYNLSEASVSSMAQ